MTIMEAIAAIDEIKPNGYSADQKVAWLSTVDGMIYRQIIQTHKDDEGISWEGYNKDTPTETVLLAEPPYDELYQYWLQSKIEFANGEYAKYNNSAIRFNDAYSNYRNYYNSQHAPKSTYIKFW